MKTFTTTQLVAIAIIVLVMIGAPVAFVAWLMSPAPPSPRDLQAPSSVSAGGVASAGTRVAPVPTPAESKAVAVVDATLAKFPYAPGWPLALPGQIIGTPVVADLEGTGKLDVVVPCVYRNSGITMVHPHPSPIPLLFAFHADGTPVDGWPIVVGGRQKVNNGPGWGTWSSSPSIFRRGDRDQVVIEAPGRAVCVIGPDRTMTRFVGGDNAINIPLADLGNGVMDITIGRVAKTVDGTPIPGWPASRVFRNGYAPCIGSATGDGKLELYHLFYTNNGTPYANLAGFDANGNPLPGWPQLIDDPSWLAPVMGNVTGDGKMDVIASYGTHLFAWSWDGKPLPNTTTDGPLNGILKSNLFAATASPALADLDVDGKAEIIVYDQQSNVLRAWHGDGVGVGDERKGPPTTQETAHNLIANLIGQPVLDGVIAKNLGGAHGVSVVSLGDDPTIMDFFTGTYWVRRFPDGKTTTTNMSAGDPRIEWTQPTIADLEGNGQADVIFGLSDGRLFVYRTGLAYHADRMQWPTANGNFQHTGVWKSQMIRTGLTAAEAFASRPIATATGLQFRLIAAPGDASDADTMLNPTDHQPVRVLKKIELDEHDVARAYLNDAGQEGKQIGIDFTEDGARKFSDLTAANINHPLAIVFNGSLLSMPTIRMQISKSAMIAGGANGFTDEQAKALIDKINAGLSPAVHK